ncbi:hypothetical protein [Algibacillus agarilyticus]|uniref:hypothetical protein n=1 Tax=Algibacillus agarilyticus TaxID=2234133 RepID=UPI000DCFE4F7|nr:hypothetical protein [Algibacillus agarilyticus]
MRAIKALIIIVIWLSFAAFISSAKAHLIQTRANVITQRISLNNHLFSNHQFNNHQKNRKDFGIITTVAF